MTSRSGLLAAALALAAVGCAPLFGSKPAHPPSGEPIGTTGLVLEGSAFGSAELRRQVAKSLEQSTRTRIVLLDRLSSPEDPEVVARAEGLGKESRARVPGKRACATHRAVLTGAMHGLDGVYAVSLDRTERSRPATAAELASPSRRSRPLVALLGLLHLAQPRTVREESLSGSMSVTGFTSLRDARRVAIARTVTQLEPTGRTPRLDVAAVIAEAVRELPAPKAPRWERVARELVSAGCPFLALVVYEDRLKPAGSHADVRRAALSAMAPRVAKPGERARRKGGAPQEAREPETPSQPEDQPEAPSQAEASGTRQDFSCAALCRMHMVQLCNNDKGLWSEHRRAWETTSCGAMREEEFLQECYRRQWLNGTFEDACVRPCENSSEGREKLIGILRRAGCVQSPS
jgi:hypothetical protein